MTIDIPIEAGKRIAEEYGYDQVVIVARKVGGREHVTTYGVDKEHCGVAARMGDFFKHKLMGWPKPDEQPEIDRLRAEVDELDALRDKLADLLNRTAVALRGPEPPLTRWSWHDLPDRAAAAIAAIDVMQRAAVMAAEHD